MAASAPTPREIGFPAEGRCGYYVTKKKRFCRMVVAVGKRFCGEHAGAAEEENSRKRILCPLDPKHTVYEDQLTKHLRKCNSREKPKPGFFVQDINAGLEDETEIPEPLVPISSLPEEQLENLIMKLKKASEGLNSTLKDQILSHPALHDALTDPKNGDSATKHLKQQASILGNIEKLKLLGPRRCFVEFGAGKGKLSHWVDIALKDAEKVHFILVEKGTTRFKVDGKHRRENAMFERLQIDIQHLCLNKVPVLSREKLPVVGIGKHLCGVATDLALRCLVATCGPRGEERNEEPLAKRIKNVRADQDVNAVAEEGSEETVAEERSPVAGIVIALCCHHRFLTVEEKKEIGHLCKLLIDQGRVEYLRQSGFHPALWRYTDPAVSLENVLLTALPELQTSKDTSDFQSMPQQGLLNCIIRQDLEQPVKLSGHLLGLLKNMASHPMTSTSTFHLH